MNPHMKYGRSDRRGYMLMEVTPKETRTRFMGLDEVRDPKTVQRELAAFRVEDGKASVEMTAI
jgi:alkaline phosphatase D